MARVTTMTRSLRTSAAALLLLAWLASGSGANGTGSDTPPIPGPQFNSPRGRGIGFAGAGVWGSTGNVLPPGGGQGAQQEPEPPVIRVRWRLLTEKNGRRVVVTGSTSSTGEVVVTVTVLPERR